METKNHNPFCQHNERIAVLETKVEEGQADVKEILSTLKTMQEELTRYKGFLGGAAFIGSCLIAAITMFWDLILKKFGGS